MLIKILGGDLNLEKSYSIKQTFIDQIMFFEDKKNKMLYTKKIVLSVLVVLLIVLILNIIFNPSQTFIIKLIFLIVADVIAIIIVSNYSPGEFPLTGTIICPHCLKNILVEKIEKITCPYCDADNLNLRHVLLGCPQCNDQIRYLNCPYCNDEIDLYTPYNIDKLKGKRYE